MARICNRCAEVIPPVVVKETGSFYCLLCGYGEPIKLLPLFIVLGVNGTGKSAVAPELRRRLGDCEVFDTDIMHAQDWVGSVNNWLKVAHSIAQGNRPTVLCGMMLPATIERCDYKDCFSQIHYLSLHCEESRRIERLQQRTFWRSAEGQYHIQEKVVVDRWLREDWERETGLPLERIDTTSRSVVEVAEQIKDWVRRHWTTSSGHR